MDIWYPNVQNPGETIMAVDPGGTTGWAIWSDGSEPIFGQTEGQLEFLREADESIFRYRPTLVCESYIISGRTVTLSRQNEPLEIIGALRWFSDEYHVPFVLQTPGQAKAFATDEKLKVMGWYNPTKGGHTNDAARHLLTFLATNRHHRQTLERLVAALD